MNSKLFSAKTFFAVFKARTMTTHGELSDARSRAALNKL